MDIGWRELRGENKEGGTSRGSYVLVVGCGVGLCWNMGEACRRLSHMCCSWYLPKVLFGGSCMCMNMASLMVLERLFTSLCTMLNWLGSMGCPVGGTVVVYRGRGLEMFLDSFPQGSARVPNVGAGALAVWALVFVDDVCLVSFGILILGVP